MAGLSNTAGRFFDAKQIGAPMIAEVVTMRGTEFRVCGSHGRTLDSFSTMDAAKASLLAFQQAVGRR